MIRLFKRHNMRKTFLLDGMWKFKTDPDRRGYEDQWFRKFPDDCVEAVVPSCWNNDLGLFDYEGLAWYSTTVDISTSNINLAFHAVTGQAEVYLDGLHVGSHYGGFTKFNVTVRGLAKGKHFLAVSVDNTHDSMNTIPLSVVDWYHYGGIIRSVEVMELGEAWIKEYRIDYTLDEQLKAAVLNFRADIETFGDVEYDGRLSVYIDDREAGNVPFEAYGLSQIEINGIRLEGIQLWDIGNPNLYTIRFDIGEDDVFDRIGLRKVSTGNGKILLNGREVYIKGVNRHEDHPDWGFSFPLRLMKRDVDIIKSLNCNAVRGSHYPNSETFLDYLDQEGILFWEEIPMWQYRDEHFTNPVVKERGLAMLEEMIRRDYHHPSIVVWGLHNEVDTRIQSCYEMTKLFADKVRGMDSTRLVTYATMYPLEDICYSLVDFVSVNIYFGWYVGKLHDWDGFLADMKLKLKKDSLSHLPVIISEFGAAGIYGVNSFEGQKWSENYQEKLLEYAIKLFHDDGGIAGCYIWQFCDMQVCGEVVLTRARGFNNKGIVNEYRKPKRAFFAVQRLYKEFDS